MYNYMNFKGKGMSDEQDKKDKKKILDGLGKSKPEEWRDAWQKAKDKEERREQRIRERIDKGVGGTEASEPASPQ